MALTIQPSPLGPKPGRHAERLWRRCGRALSALCFWQKPLFFRTNVPPPRRALSSREWYREQALSDDALTLLDPQCSVEWRKSGFTVSHPLFGEGEWATLSYLLPETFVLKVPFGRVIGRHGTVVDNANILIKDVSRTSFPPVNGEHYLLHEPALNPLRRKPGRYAVISPPAHATFHWLYEVLPRFELLRRAGYPPESFDGFYLAPPKYDAYYVTLDLLGIPKEKIVWTTRHSHFGSEELVVPSYCGVGYLLHPWVYPFLKRLAGIPEECGPKPRRRIYISRRDAAMRRIVNEDEVSSLLQEYGFEEVMLSGLDFREQAELFASAEFIVTPHGGGLANLCFSHAPCKVVELFAPDYAPLYYCYIAMSMGFDYEALVGEPVRVAEVQKNGGDIRLSVGDLRRVVEAMLAR